jgi:hypothetical protein
MPIFNLNVINDEEAQAKENEEAGKADETNKIVEAKTIAVPDDNISPEAAKEEKSIVLDGPLSHIYTQALNAAFSLEGFASNPVWMKQETTEIDPDDLYVYCCDADTLDNQALITLVDNITEAANKGGHVEVAIECNKQIPKNIGILEDFCKSNKYPVHYSRESLLDSIKGQRGF